MGKKQEEQIYQERRQQETPKRSTTENQGNNLQISIKQKKELNLSTVHTHKRKGSKLELHPYIFSFGRHN